MAISSNLMLETLSELKNLFSFDNNQSIDTIENANLINGINLLTDFPAKYQDTNKRALLNDILQNQKYCPSNGDILITRFYPKQLPPIYTFEQHNDLSKEYIFISNVFDYESTNDPNVIEWHMNFSNYDIFSFYNGSLLAQDELQVLECPQLASLREYLKQKNTNIINNNKLVKTYVIENNLPYPILISNIERVIELDTKNLYGNRFSLSSESTVLNSYKYLQPPQIINIIGIEAPKYGYGQYKRPQIEYTLHACFTAYSAAKTLANITYKLNNKEQLPNIPLKTYIHTGWFGCGAYGGNRTLMIVLQILAAKMAAIDKLIFHTVTNDYQKEIEDAEKYLKNIFDKDQNELLIDELIQKILNEKFQWGFGDGT